MNDVHPRLVGSPTLVWRAEVALLNTSNPNLLRRKYRHYVTSARGRARLVSVSIDRISELLHEAAETHHVVYRIVDGDDPDWASWYGDWLLNLSELPDLLGAKPVRSHLVHALVQLDRDYTAGKQGEPWEKWYATRLVEQFS
jgi:hypothetical protein